jgi:hypothetical protein
VIITRWNNLLDTQGKPEDIDWLALCAEFSRVRPFAGDNLHPGWSAAEFRDDRRGRDAVLRVFALCLDYDSGETIEGAERTWDGYAALIHTTRKHTAEAPRFRVVLPLSRPVTAAEYDELWPRVAHHAGPVDQAPKDPSRFWFVPGVGAHEGAEFYAKRLRGDPLDPDEWLAKPLPAPKPITTDRDLKPTDPTQAERRARAYIAKMPEAVSGEHGHDATWAVAVVLAKGFGFDEEQTYRILRDDYNPRCRPAWKDKELRHKAQQAQAARLPDGFMLENDWQPRNDMPPVPFNEEPPDWYRDEPEETAPPEQPAPEPEQPPKTAVENYGVLSIRQLLELSVARIEAGRLEMGVRTGYAELDKAIAGFRRGNVTILGAKPSFGKTSWTIALTNAAITDGDPVLIVGAEDVACMYGDRFLALRAQLNATAIRDLELNDREKDVARRSVALAPATPTFLPARGKTSREVSKAIRLLVKELGVKLVVVDFLQRIRCGRRVQDRRNEVTMVCEEITDAIKSENAAGLVLSAFKRTEHEKPEIEDLKESGDLEYMAEHVLLGWKRKLVDRLSKEVHVERVLLVAKNKDGIDPSQIGEIVMPFDPVTASFTRVPERAGYTREQPPDDYYDHRLAAAGDLD